MTAAAAAAAPTATATATAATAAHGVAAVTKSLCCYCGHGVVSLSCRANDALGTGTRPALQLAALAAAA